MYNFLNRTLFLQILESSFMETPDLCECVGPVRIELHAILGSKLSDVANTLTHQTRPISLGEKDMARIQVEKNKGLGLMVLVPWLIGTQANRRH